MIALFKLTHYPPPLREKQRKPRMCWGGKSRCSDTIPGTNQARRGWRKRPGPPGDARRAGALSPAPFSRVALVTNDRAATSR